MNRFVALLRAVNVSGKNAVGMADLRQALAAIGLADVRSYLQSGNIVFASEEGDAAPLAAAIGACIAGKFGFRIEVLVLPTPALDDLVAANPLLPAGAFDETQFHATFLFAPVAADAFARLSPPAQPGERAVLCGQAVLLHCPHGYGKTRLNNAWFENALGVPATTRNWRTVRALQTLGAE